MSTASNHGSGGLWDKFRSSTKSLSSSISNLSVRTESDGDSVTSTVVHKALVKFYKEQEPFTGFPGWLGHKVDLPNEQKILKKQNHVSSNPITNGLHHMRKASSDLKKRNSSGPSPFHEPEQHSSAGMSFHKIYMSETIDAASEPSQLVKQSSVVSSIDVRSQQNTSQNVEISSSSMMMRERLKRQNTKTSINVGIR